MLLLVGPGVRKDRGRAMRRDKRRVAGPGGKMEHRKVPPQERRRHGGSGSSSMGIGGKSSVADMPPDQVLSHDETENIDRQFVDNVPRKIL